MREHKSRFSTGRQRHSGAVLIVSLIIMLVLTLLGITAMQTSTIGEKMTGNAQDRNLAFQAAEAALRQAEIFLQKPAIPTFNDTNGLYSTQDNTLWKTIDWNDTSKVISYTGNLGKVAEQPKYFYEELSRTATPGTAITLGYGSGETSGNFRITARAVGGTKTSVVILRETFRR